jgi:hypothetical protein
LCNPCDEDDEDEQFFLPSFTINGAPVEWNWQGNRTTYIPKATDVAAVLTCWATKVHYSSSSSSSLSSLSSSSPSSWSWPSSSHFKTVTFWNVKPCRVWWMLTSSISVACCLRLESSSAFFYLARRRQQVPLERCYTSTKLHALTFQKTP